MKTHPSLPKRPTVAIETHGCKLNLADSGLMARNFAEAGFRVVGPDDQADVVVINSCTVTHVADRKARHALRSARRRHPAATVVATGCYVRRSPEDLRRLVEVDLVIGDTDNASLVRKVIESRGATPIAPVEADGSGVQLPVSRRTRAMVKIQEGCNQVCAFCIVPKVRGRERSILPDDIVEQINRLVATGCKEVVLTGTQLGSYGFDLRNMNLARLLESILSRTDLPRLRVSSLQPQDISTEMLDLWSDGRLCPHFHMALQSGSDAVLSRMRRRYTVGMYADALDTIRRDVHDVSITADVIAGFPGETECEFEETLALCEQAGFADMHVFPFSVRPGTTAAHLQSQVSSDVKARRVQELLGLAKRNAAEFRKGFLGRTLTVLWENAWRGSEPTRWSGLTDNYIRVSAESSRDLNNQITPAWLVRQDGEAVYARVL